MIDITNTNLVLMLGDSGVGKSSLLASLVHGGFVTESISTTKCDYIKHEFTIDSSI